MASMYYASDMITHPTSMGGVTALRLLQTRVQYQTGMELNKTTPHSIRDRQTDREREYIYLSCDHKVCLWVLEC